MSNYHSKEAFDARMKSRHENWTLPTPVGFFYHISMMPGWELIVQEQLEVCKVANVEEVFSCVLGSKEDLARLVKLAEVIGVRLVILDHKESLDYYERPTLREVWKWSKANPTGMVVYFHTKGVSNPADHHKRHWRRLMMKNVVWDWKECQRQAAVADVVGCAWQESADYPHFCGNIWVSRCDWLNKLQDPEEYRLSRPDFQWAGVHSWRNRMHVETWLGSIGWHHVGERVGMSVQLWNNTVYRYDVSIPGYTYPTSIPKLDNLVGLNLGCGPFRVEGWLNVDVIEDENIRPDQVIEAGKSLPYPNGTFDKVFMGHVLEHVPWSQVAWLLTEVRRVIRPGGSICVVGPDVMKTLHRVRNDSNLEEAIHFFRIVMEDGFHYQDSQHREWDGARHHWNCYAERVVFALKASGYQDIQERQIEPDQLVGWPVVDFLNKWQCAVTASV